MIHKPEAEFWDTATEAHAAFRPRRRAFRNHHPPADSAGISDAPVTFGIAENPYSGMIDSWAYTFTV